MGGQFKRFAPGDFDGLRDAFVDFVPDHGGLFQPEVRRCDAGGLDIKFHACPLKEAWQDARHHLEAGRGRLLSPARPPRPRLNSPPSSAQGGIA